MVLSKCAAAISLDKSQSGSCGFPRPFFTAALHGCRQMAVFIQSSYQYVVQVGCRVVPVHRGKRIFLLIIYSWGLLRGSYILYSALMLTVMVSSGLLVSMMRYNLDIFPLSISLAILGRRCLFRQSIIPLSACLSGFFMAVFALWRWAA